MKEILPFFRSCALATNIKNLRCANVFKRHYVKNEQEQSQQKQSIRTYFYYIDHQGMLFLDNARMKNFTSSFKDKKFLVFFFKNMRINTDSYKKNFPYVSLCGRERNYVRCDDVPIVFTKIIHKKDNETGKHIDLIGYAHAEEFLSVPFEPQMLYMNIQSGRVYHPAPEKVGGIGLVRSQLAFELSKCFLFEKGEEKGPTHIIWKDHTITLDTEWYKIKEVQTKEENEA